MTSREISEVTGKEHYNVLRDIKSLIEGGSICALNFEVTSFPMPMPKGGIRRMTVILVYKTTYLIDITLDKPR
jgi:phage regulator Rha-like protein